MGRSLVQMLGLLSVLVLVSCGPEKTARERELDQLAKNTAQDKANNNEVAGWYGGTLTFTKLGTSEPICLYIYSTSVFQDIPSRGQTIEIPVLGTYVYTKNPNVSYLLGNSNYDVKNKVVRFSGGNFLLELYIRGNQMTGGLFAPLVVNDVNVTKMDRDYCLKGLAK